MRGLETRLRVLGARTLDGPDARGFGTGLLDDVVSSCALALIRLVVGPGRDGDDVLGGRVDADARVRLLGRAGTVAGLGASRESTSANVCASEVVGGVSAEREDVAGRSRRGRGYDRGDAARPRPRRVRGGRCFPETPDVPVPRARRARGDAEQPADAGDAREDEHDSERGGQDAPRVVAARVDVRAEPSRHPVVRLVVRDARAECRRYAYGIVSRSDRFQCIVMMTRRSLD